MRDALVRAAARFGQTLRARDASFEQLLRAFLEQPRPSRKVLALARHEFDAARRELHAARPTHVEELLQRHPKLRQALQLDAHALRCVVCGGHDPLPCSALCCGHTVHSTCATGLLLMSYNAARGVWCPGCGRTVMTGAEVTAALR